MKAAAKESNKNLPTFKTIPFLWRTRRYWSPEPTNEEVVD